MSRSMPAIAILVMLATPALAQSSSSSNEIQDCKNKLEAGITDTAGTKDPAKQAAASKEIELARAAMAKGNGTECLIYVDKATNARK